MKKPKKDKINDPETRKLIKELLKKEKTKLYIMARLGFNSKVTQYIIDRYELEDNLTIPRLVGVR